MKSLIVIAGIMLCAALRGSDDAGATASAAYVYFDGYMQSSDGSLFAVSLKKPDGSVTARAWMTIGQSLGSHTILSFDDRDESLLVRDAAGKYRRLKLPIDRIRESPPTSPEMSTGFRHAMTQVEMFLHRLRSEWKDPVEFKLDSEGEAMPTEVRTRFLALRAREESKAGYLIGISIDQEWHFALFSGQAASTMIGDLLTEAERQKVEAAWALAIAEASARAIARRKRGDPMPVLALGSNK